MKLLDKSIRLYLLYAALILLIAVPVLYFSIQRIIAEDADESLVAQKEKIISKLNRINDISFLESLQNLDADITLLPAKKPVARKDTLYNIEIYDDISKEVVPYRVLESDLLLKEKLSTIRLQSSLVDSRDLIKSIVKITALLLLLIITGLVLINRVLSKKLWRPFYNSIDKLNGFKIEKDGVLHLEKTNITEFADLNRAITALTKRSQETYQSQKEFTENASHEMQTPLAIFRGKVDLLMQTTPLNREQSELIGDLADINQRMNHLNKSLLLLAKIENNQFTETESMPVRKVLENLAGQYRFQAEQKNITIITEETGEVVVEANKMLLEIMFGNFLSNAIKHNIQNGSVNISIKNNAVTFLNTGSPAPLETSKIFQRFHKQTTDKTSIGLGLQISKKIADYYNYTISYGFYNQQHQFTILLK